MISFGKCEYCGKKSFLYYGDCGTCNCKCNALSMTKEEQKIVWKRGFEFISCWFCNGIIYRKEE